MTNYISMINLNYFVLLLFIGINTYFFINFKNIFFFHFIKDIPDKKRKLHKKPTSLAGGIILIVNILIYYFWTCLNENILTSESIFNSYNELNVFLFSTLSIFIVGFFDDKYSLSPSLKFILLSLIISVTLMYDSNLNILSLKFSFTEKILHLENYSFIFTFFCLIVFLNAFNMFDGVNLQASTYTLLIIFVISLFYSNDFLNKILIIFLIFYSFLNYQNKSFLGDSGSLLLGFIIGYIFIKLYNYNKIIYSDEIVIFMLLPGFELIRLFFIRILNKNNPLQPDRQHIHHILIKKFSLKKTLFIMQIMIFLPIILSLTEINKVLVILIFIVYYFFTIKKLNF